MMKNLKIGTQLMIGFAAISVFVIVLSMVGYQHTNLLGQQTQLIMEHPLIVREAVDHLNSDIQYMRLGLRDLMLADKDPERREANQLMELSALDAQLQFKLLKDHYLGPASDIEDADKAFFIWKMAREEVIKQTLAGEIEQVKKSLLPAGQLGIYGEQLNAKIEKIDHFALKKAQELNANSIDLKKSLNLDLAELVIAILILTFIIDFILFKNIREPITELTSVANRFHNGELGARSFYKSHNEFGLLSESFNILVEQIQANQEMDKKIANLAGLMLNENDIRKFFRAILYALATNTDSQMAAVYLLSGDKQTYNYFESTGMDHRAKASFAAESHEGEFGSVITSRKVQLVQNIPEDSRFIFNTVSGKFFPREIVTLPILANGEIIAIISLASIGKYSLKSIQLIDNILITLCARIEGILSFHKLKAFSEKLNVQNRELEAQQAELITQSTELTQQNVELEMQKQQLKEVSQLKTNFLSNMSHELRTPLNSVIALAGVLSRRLDKKIPEEESSYLEIIERNGKLLLSLINDILDISRIEAGREEIEITTFDMSQLISEVFRMINPQAQNNQTKLIYKESNHNLSISTDMDKCRHILQNLIGNAVKFTKQGSVEILTEKRNNNLLIRVIDNGIGIPEDHLPHIFDEFRQADGSTSRRFGGTGLGLAIAKKYATLLGGTISVLSTPGKGSKFTLNLPLHIVAKEAGTNPQPNIRLIHPPIQSPHSGKLRVTDKTVLLVEDSDPAIIQLKDFLLESGYQVLVAREGGEALALIAQTIPDAMILDLMMPGIDGFEVLKTIREAEPTAHIPVLILTAKQITNEELGFLKRNNVHQLVQKGDVNRDELLIALSDMVGPAEEQLVKPKTEIQIIEGKPLVLVVEDNPDNMITVKALLDDKHTVLEAINGHEGIVMARKYKPNLILMDIALPGIDGIEAFKIIREDNELNKIPVIALTASAMTTDRETILEYGLDGYIAKPIDQKSFFKTINSVLYGK